MMKKILTLPADTHEVQIKKYQNYFQKPLFHSSLIVPKSLIAFIEMMSLITRQLSKRKNAMGIH
jgi:hypothetical protein